MIRNMKKAGEGMQVVVSRCPVATATELAMKKGWLQKALEEQGGEFCLLQSMDKRFHQCHFTQQAPLHFREGGNIPPLWARAQGERCVLLGVSFQRERRGIYVRPEDSIRTPADLRGRRLAIPVRDEAVVDFRRMTMLHGFRDVLRGYGLTLEDVELVPVRARNISAAAAVGKKMDVLRRDDDFLTEDFQAVLDGGADAVFANSVKAVRHDRAGVLRDIMTEEDQRAIPNVNNNAVLPLTCTKPFADEHPEMVVTYLKTVILAARWAAGHREEFIETVCGGVYGATPEEMGLAFDLPYLFAHREPVLDETAFSMLEEEKTFLLENGVIRAQDDYDLRDWAAPHFLIQALEAADRESV